MTEESDGRRRGNPATVLLLGGMLLLALYIVSPIPLSYVLNHSATRGGASLPLRRFYSPFAWAREHTFLAQPIDKYGRFLSKL